MRLEIKIVPYHPLPPKIQHLKGIINIQNQDDKCFLWCVLAAIHPVNHNPHRVQHYLPFQDELNMNGISFPTPLSQIKKFEEQNKISINVFGFEKELFPLYISQLDQAAKNVDLLYSQENGNSHFCLITDLNRVLGSIKDIRTNTVSVAAVYTVSPEKS